MTRVQSSEKLTTELQSLTTDIRIGFSLSVCLFAMLAVEIPTFAGMTGRAVARASLELASCEIQ